MPIWRVTESRTLPRRRWINLQSRELLGNDAFLSTSYLVPHVILGFPIRANDQATQILEIQNGSGEVDLKS